MSGISSVRFGEAGGESSSSGMEVDTAGESSRMEPLTSRTVAVVGGEERGSSSTMQVDTEEAFLRITNDIRELSIGLVRNPTREAKGEDFSYIANNIKEFLSEPAMNPSRCSHRRTLFGIELFECLQRRGLEEGEMKELLRNCLERLVDLHALDESLLRKEEIIFEELSYLEQKMREIDLRNKDVQGYTPGRKLIPNTINCYRNICVSRMYRKFEEWAKERNIPIPSDIPKGFGLISEDALHARVKAIKHMHETYIQEGCPQEVILLANNLASYFNYESHHHEITTICYDLVRKKCLDQFFEIFPLLPPNQDRDDLLFHVSSIFLEQKNASAAEACLSQVIDPKFLLGRRYAFSGSHHLPGCLFLLCRMYIQEDQAGKAFDLMQHVLRVAEHWKDKIEPPSFEAVGALFDDV